LQSKEIILCEVLILVLIIGYFDYITGYDISLLTFYGIPILMAVWFTDRKSSYLVAVFCALVWWWADAKSGHIYLRDWYVAYNAFIRLTFFLFVVVGGGALKARIELIERSRLLEMEIIKISEREQQRIGQDLHDGLCQYFAAVGCAASSLRNDLKELGIPQAEAAGDIAELLRQGVTQTRNVSRGLFPVQMDEAGLESALEELAGNSSQLMNIECSLKCREPVPVYDNIAATQLYRICQEALSNATRHGLATKVDIVLERAGGTVTVRIIDNGKGLPPAGAKSDGMGMKIMHYRARLIGGRLKISSTPGGGTEVDCSFKQTENSKDE